MSTPTAQPASQVIADALLDLNVIRSGQTPNAAQQATLIRKLNEMMALSPFNRLGYVPVGTVTAILTVPDEAILGIRTHLAIHSASAFGASISAELAASAEIGMAAIYRVCAQEIPITTDLQPSADTGGVYNIETG